MFMGESRFFPNLLLFKHVKYTNYVFKLKKKKGSFGITCSSRPASRKHSFLLRVFLSHLSKNLEIFR